MPIDGQSVVTQVSNQVSHDLEGETAVLNLESMSYFCLNQVGRCIWEALKEPKTVNKICEGICQEFEVSEEQCKADVLGFLDELDKAGLIEISEPD
jgi:hypothetical protein